MMVHGLCGDDRFVLFGPQLGHANLRDQQHTTWADARGSAGQSVGVALRCVAADSVGGGRPQLAAVQALSRRRVCSWHAVVVVVIVASTS
jgi:hypothetical protein